MTEWEILLIGIALSMDAFAVGMADGMTEPKMSFAKMLAVALAFAVFQYCMPLIGYSLGAAFSALVAKIAPYLSFGLLAVLGGKMIFDSVAGSAGRRNLLCPYLIKDRQPLGAGKLFVQAVATSLDALAVGVTLLAAETGAGLPFSVYLCTLVIGATTFSLSLFAVAAGKKAGVRFSGEAEILGGAILVAIGLKILLEGIL